VRLFLVRLFDWVWYRPNPLKWLLWPVSWIYVIVVRLRQFAYRFGIRNATKLPVPVVVVGNITVGGTGKTPCVIWLARALTGRGLRVGIVSRGYGGSAASWPQRVEAGSDPAIVGDEPILIARSTGCRVVVGPSRVSAARSLLDHEEVDVLLCDDGLQHLALDRDMELVVIDGQRGLGNGLCLPAGPLREPAARLQSVDAVIVNSGTSSIQNAVAATVVVDRVYQLAGTMEKSLSEFHGQRVHAVAGIGNPNRFFDLLSNAGLIVIPHAHPDHARLSAAQLNFHDSQPILITEKDGVKCQSFAAENVWCVAISLAFDADDETRLLEHVIGLVN
jgi:tetraacyldisaccharide 4'-kinase